MTDAPTMERLAFIRYLFGLGLDQSEQPEPLSAVSVLTFHDAVELFLQLTSEQLNVGKSKLDFMQYWSEIDPALSPNRLSQREAMRRLNSARISLKHHGTLPAKLSVEQFRASVGSFFEENTPLVFAIAFDSVSLADLIEIEATRHAVREAEEHISTGDLAKAMSALAVAFACLIDETEIRFQERYGRSPFAFGPSFSPFDRSFFNRSAVPDQGRDKLTDGVLEALEAMQSAMKIVTLGIDYQRYVRFKLLSPNAHRTMGSGGKYQVIVSQGFRGAIKWPPTADACRFSLGFVVGSALRVQSVVPAST